MIGATRALIRLLGGVTFLFAWTLGHVVAFPLAVVSSRGRARWRASYLRGACRGLLIIIGVHVRTLGTAPSGVGFLVTNHLGYLDVLVLASQLDACFVSRADVRDWPVLGPLTRMAGTIFLDRDRRTALPDVVARMERELEAGFTVIFFPEGTSGRGDVLMPFRPSLFEAPVRAAAPVRCAALHYATSPPEPPAELAVCWWGDMPFGGHLWGLLSLPRVDATLSWSAVEVQASERKVAAAHAEAAVATVFRPLAQAFAS